MPTLTTNYSFNKPLVNNATDADLWGGYLNANWDSLDTILDGIGQLPVKSVFFTIDNTNPATLLGYGTWTQRAEGRFIVGVGEGTDAVSATRTYSAGEDSVGEYKHSLTAEENGPHTHTIPSDIAGNSSNNSIVDAGTTADGVATTSSSGSGTAHENSPPAFGLYVWERTA